MHCLQLISSIWRCAPGGKGLWWTHLCLQYFSTVLAESKHSKQTGWMNGQWVTILLSFALISQLQQNVLPCLSFSNTELLFAKSKYEKDQCIVFSLFPLFLQSANPFSYLFTRLIEHSLSGDQFIINVFYNNKIYSNKLIWSFILGVCIRQNRHSPQQARADVARTQAHAVILESKDCFIFQSDLCLQT